MIEILLRNIRHDQYVKSPDFPLILVGEWTRQVAPRWCRILPAKPMFPVVIVEKVPYFLAGHVDSESRCFNVRESVCSKG